MITNMTDLVEDKIRKILIGRKIIWIGGSSHLVRPSLSQHVSGGVYFSMDPSDQKFLVNQSFFLLESYFTARPDWNRIDDLSLNKALPIGCKQALSAKKNCAVFPYYVSEFASDLARENHFPLLGNPHQVCETLYFRDVAREVVAGTDFCLPHVLTFHRGSEPNYRALTLQLGTRNLVLTPPYSDGGAWVYPVSDSDSYNEAVSAILGEFTPPILEVSPFYEGIPVNIHACNLPAKNGEECKVVAYPPSVQIIGHPNLSDEKLRYCGCDFAVGQLILQAIGEERLYNICKKVGQILFSKYGWRGMFGIDFLLQKDGTLIFMEINPRLQASTHILDIEIRDDYNPILLHLSAFNSNDTDIAESVASMRYKIAGSLLLAYNSMNTRLKAMDRIPEGGARLVDPGGILFRNHFPYGILEPDFKTIKRNVLDLALVQKKQYSKACSSLRLAAS